jgi:hypothetical protein
MASNANGPDRVDLFEVKRRMAGIGLQQGEVLDGETANFNRERLIQRPESPRSAGRQRRSL